MSRCAYRISWIRDVDEPGLSISYTITEGEVAAENEVQRSSGVGNETVSVTRYRATRILEDSNTRSFSRSSYIAELNQYMADTYVTGDRTAISEQAL